MNYNGTTVYVYTKYLTKPQDTVTYKYIRHYSHYWLNHYFTLWANTNHPANTRMGIECWFAESDQYEETPPDPVTAEDRFYDQFFLPSGNSQVDCNGRCRTDFGDIRFTTEDGTTELDYWMEEKLDGEYAIFWVKVPSIPASPDKATIYVYYGKEDATTTSNIFNTFDLADDFNRADSSIVGEDWIEDEDAGVGALSIENNALKIYQYQNYYCHIEKASPALSTLVLRGKIKTGTYGGFGWAPRINVYWSPYNWVGVGYGSYILGDQWAAEWDIDGTNNRNTLVGGILNTWHFYRIRVASEAVYTEVSTNGETWSTVATITRPSSWSGNPSLIIVGKGYAGNEGSYPNADLDNNNTSAGNVGTHYADDILVRKYVDPEPSHGSWGSEES
jgi:hypothetical protein